MLYNKYILLKDIPEYKLKKGMIFEWNKLEKCYTTNSLSWFLTPLIEKRQLNKMIKDKLIKQII